MNFDAMKEQLRDRFLEIWSRVQESSLYMNLREKYESLNPQAQKLIVIGLSVFAILFALSFPYGYIVTSQENLTTFEEDRELIRGLLKSAATLREPSPLPPAISVEALTSDIRQSLEEFRLIPDQVGGIQPILQKVTNLVPESVQQIGALVTLKKLNLRQVVEISHRFQALSPGVRVIGLDIKENQTSHYFDAIYKLASFSTPPPPSDVNRPPPPPVRQRKDSDETDF